MKILTQEVFLINYLNLDNKIIIKTKTKTKINNENVNNKRIKINLLS